MTIMKFVECCYNCQYYCVREIECKERLTVVKTKLRLMLPYLTHILG